MQIPSPHAFPTDLARFVAARWEGDSKPLPLYKWGVGGVGDPLPPPATLEHLLADCYQASLLREEGREVRLRLMVRDADRFPPDAGPPDGLHRLLFAAPRPFDEHELRRLFPASNFHRSLVGVSLDGGGEPRIWGQIHSGVSWIEAIEGARRTFDPLPDSLVISILGPGRITVSKGSRTVARLVGGRISSPAMEVGEAAWAREAFTETRKELHRLHLEARRASGESWAPLDDDFVRIVGQRVGRQLVSVVRNASHGGTLLLLPNALADEACRPNRFLSLKYIFADEEPRRRLRTLIVQLMNALARCNAGNVEPSRTVGWFDYLHCADAEIARLDESIVETCHYIAGLAAVDGAVAMTKTYELLGFGGEISGELDAVPSIAKALDAEGTRVSAEATDGFGTRHRSVYRLCNTLHDAVAIVISQDGGVRSVKWNEGSVTTWDQLATSTLDL